ncbi:hypothetical protein [Asticcacaulis excentricus]|uniref:Uncharacterized protein n=1 Tax=Asticcacaulis excentricus (strain ATCC 15261 / DSM 4724 / KCTC 12464 / NCIMB 9791 / VKM B-1370 / CB 48) TaxID=573065 RepID=E8RV04_ASTEC|nr:hypothetical protein [Asticcacaulis excentricus]ADU14204.1 hypothetical protein Astex_2554 [Asticcacaulis excentricus CB 48]
MSAIFAADAALRARRVLCLSLWTAGVVLTVGSGAVAARIATFDGTMLTQVDDRRDPHAIFPATESVERDVLDVRPTVMATLTRAGVWPATEALPSPEHPSSVSSKTSAAADMVYVSPDASDTAAPVEATRPRAVPGVIECTDTCFDASQVATEAVETAGGDTASLPTVTPEAAAKPETVALDDLLPRR